MEFQIYMVFLELIIGFYFYIDLKFTYYKTIFLTQIHNSSYFVLW